MDKTVCVFCGEEAEFEGTPVVNGADLLGERIGYACGPCGRYVIDDVLQEELAKDTQGRRFRAACLLREKRLRGIPGRVGVFSANSEIGACTVDKELVRSWRIDELLAEFPKATELIDRSLMNLRWLVKHPMDAIVKTLDQLQYLVFTPKNSVTAVYQYMLDMRLVLRIVESDDEYQFRVSPHGWNRIDELSRAPRESRQAFVAMWSSPETDATYKNGIAPAINDAGYCPQLIVIKEHNNDICDEIIAEIRKSRFVVADFTAGCCKKCRGCSDEPTCRDRVRPRGGVYFEAGFAMGLAIPVIWTVRKDQIDQVHFDTRQYNHIDYETAEELRTRLRNRIKATIV